jgi:rubrerythrin
MRNDSDDGFYRDRDYEFDVTCTNCGTVYGSLHDGPCPSCGSSSQTFSSFDARVWNEHLRRTGR